MAALEDYRFKHSYSDYSPFNLKKGKVRVNILVYVDDLIIFGNEPKVIREFKIYLDKTSHEGFGYIEMFSGSGSLQKFRRNLLEPTKICIGYYLRGWIIRF